MPGEKQQQLAPYDSDDTGDINDESQVHAGGKMGSGHFSMMQGESMRKSDTKLFEYLNEAGKRNLDDYRRMADEKARKEVEECTFKPVINP